MPSPPLIALVAATSIAAQPPSGDVAATMKLLILPKLASVESLPGWQYGHNDELGTLVYGRAWAAVRMPARGWEYVRALQAAELDGAEALTSVSLKRQGKDQARIMNLSFYPVRTKAGAPVVTGMPPGTKVKAGRMAEPALRAITGLDPFTAIHDFGKVDFALQGGNKLTAYYWTMAKATCLLFTNGEPKAGKLPWQVETLPLPGKR